MNESLHDVASLYLLVFVISSIYLVYIPITSMLCHLSVQFSETGEMPRGIQPIFDVGWRLVSTDPVTRPDTLQ